MLKSDETFLNMNMFIDVLLSCLVHVSLIKCIFVFPGTLGMSAGIPTQALM